MMIEDSERIIPLSNENRKQIKKSKNEDTDWSVNTSTGFEGVVYCMEYVENILTKLWTTYQDWNKKTFSEGSGNAAKIQAEKNIANGKDSSTHENFLSIIHDSGRFTEVQFFIYRDLFLRNAVYKKMRRNLKEMAPCFPEKYKEFLKILRNEMDNTTLNNTTVYKGTNPTGCCNVCCCNVCCNYAMDVDDVK